MRMALINLERQRKRSLKNLYKALCSCKSTERKLVYTLLKQLYNHCGDDSVEDPPVPIPNTEVKLNCAESTWLDTAWEDRELPHFILEKTRKLRVF